MFVKSANLLLLLLGLTFITTDASIDIRQNTNESAFELIREQVVYEYEAFYLYEKFSADFAQPTVGRLGFSRLFRSMANEELGHARKMTEYITDRGESLENVYKAIMIDTAFVPAKLTAAAVVEKALKFEMKLNTELLDLHKKADKVTDPHLQDFLEREYLDEQVKSIRDLRILLTRLTNANNHKDIEFLIDQELMKKYEKKN